MENHIRMKILLILVYQLKWTLDQSMMNDLFQSLVA
jgi:hypothetical protein